MKSINIIDHIKVRSQKIVGYRTLSLTLIFELNFSIETDAMKSTIFEEVQRSLAR